jgi:hypothetical protein
VLPHLPAEIVSRDREALSAPARPRRRRADGRVERDVPIATSRDPRPRVLPAAQRDERPVAPADRTALEPVGRPRTVEHETGVDLELRDPGRALQLV